jgi:hypothetical protein
MPFSFCPVCGGRSIVHLPITNHVVCYACQSVLEIVDLADRLAVHVLEQAPLFEEVQEDPVQDDRYTMGNGGKELHYEPITE